MATVTPATAHTTTGVIDCDVHNSLRDPRDLIPYLPESWHAAYAEGSAHGGKNGGLLVGASELPAGGGPFSLDTIPAVGPSGSDLDLMREQLLDRYNVRGAILQPINDISGVPREGEFGLAVAAALNDWLADEWLARDDRLYGAITVPYEDGARAAKEIGRVAANPRFVAVLVLAPTLEGLGAPKYRPMLEAAASHGLPVALHVGGRGAAVSGAGWPVYHIEFHAAYPQAFHATVVSLLSNGVFAALPSLQIVLEEAGLAWMPPLMWRLDRAWREMGPQVARLDRLPSEIIREHFWFTTQPFEMPARSEDLIHMLEVLDMNDRIMFSSDYPHFDWDDPYRVFQASIVGQPLHEKVFSGNAARLFGLENGRGE